MRNFFESDIGDIIVFEKVISVCYSKKEDEYQVTFIDISSIELPLKEGERFKKEFKDYLKHKNRASYYAEIKDGLKISDGDCAKLDLIITEMEKST